MNTFSDYDTEKSIMRNLISEVYTIISKRWKIELDSEIPKMGVHYFYSEIEKCNSYKLLAEALLSKNNVQKKYSKDFIHHPILTFINAVFASIQRLEYLEKIIDYWWEYFCKYLESESIPVRLLIGLSNFEAENSEYVLNSETRIKYFGDNSLYDEMDKFATIWQGLIFPENPSLTIDCHGVIQVDFTVIANRHNIEAHQYSFNSIEKELSLSYALCLSNFGYIGTNPRIAILNPEFPIDTIHVIGKDPPLLFDKPKFILNSQTWERFCNIYTLITRLQDDEKRNVEKGGDYRRRLHRAITRYHMSYNQEFWESMIIDLVIIMESILTPPRGGGRIPISLSASNLLGISEPETREIFENIGEMYNIRNELLHGEPSTEENIDNTLEKILINTGYKGENGEQDVNEYALEIIRDYARRSICAMLNLFYAPGFSFGKDSLKDLQKLHLNIRHKTEIQNLCKCYSFEGRPILGLLK